MPKPEPEALNPRGQPVYVPTFRIVPRQDGGKRALHLEAAGSSYSGPVPGDESREEPFVIADIERWIRICQNGSPALEPSSGAELWRCEMQGKLLAMGDHKGGTATSYSIVSELLQYIARSMPWIAAAQSRDRLIEEMRRMVARCEHSVRQRIESGAAGCSLAVAYVTWPDVYLAGMSGGRVYLVRDGRVHPITTADSGGERQAPGRQAPGKAGLPQVPGTGVCTFSVRRNDWLLLCSEGLSQALGEAFMCQIICEARSPDQASERLIAAARARSDRHPLTAVVCRPRSDYGRRLGGRN